MLCLTQRCKIMTKLKAVTFHFVPPDIDPRKFNRPEHVTNFFEYVLCPIESDRIRGIQVFFNSCKTEIIDYLDTVQCYWIFDFQLYSNFDKTGKDEFVLSTVDSVMQELGKKFGWDVEAASKAVATVRDNNYYFRGEWGKSKSSPSRKRRAVIWLNYEDQLEAYLRIYEKKLLVGEEKLTLSIAGFPSLSDSIRKIEWQSESLVRVYNSNLRDYWTFDLIANRLNYHYLRNETNDGHGEFILGMMYMEGRIVLMDFQKGIDLINVAASKGYRHAISYLKTLEKSKLERQNDV